MASFSLHPFCLLCWWLFRLERGEAIKPTPRLTVTHKNHQEGVRPRRFQVLRKVSSERATHPVVRPTRTHTLPRRNCIIANLAALTHSITEMKWAYLLLLRCCSFYARSRLLFVSLAVGFIFFRLFFCASPTQGRCGFPAQLLATRSGPPRGESLALGFTPQSRLNNVRCVKVRRPIFFVCFVFRL